MNLELSAGQGHEVRLAASLEQTLELWQQSCARLAAELPEHQFNTWIRPLTLAPEGALFGGDPGDADAAGSPGVVAVQVPNRFKLDWIRTQYSGRIESLLSELAGRPMRLEFALAPRAEASGSASRQRNSAAKNASIAPTSDAGQRVRYCASRSRPRHVSMPILVGGSSCAISSK